LGGIIHRSVEEHDILPPLCCDTEGLPPLCDTLRFCSYRNACKHIKGRLGEREREREREREERGIEREREKERERERGLVNGAEHRFFLSSW